MVCDSVSLSGFHKKKVNSLNVLNFCTNQEYRIVNPCWRCFSVSDGNKNRYCSDAELELLTWRTPRCKYCERAAKRHDESNTSAAARTQHEAAQLQVALTNGNDSGSFLFSCHGNRNTLLNVACTWTQRHCLCRLPFPAPVTRARFPANEISMFAQVEERLRGFTTKSVTRIRSCTHDALVPCVDQEVGRFQLPPIALTRFHLLCAVMCVARRAHAEELTRQGWAGGLQAAAARTVLSTV